MAETMPESLKEVAKEVKRAKKTHILSLSGLKIKFCT